MPTQRHPLPSPPSTTIDADEIVTVGRDATPDRWRYKDDGFAQAPTDTDNKPFGYDATLSTLDGSHNAVRVFEPNSRQVAKVIEQEFSGSFSVDFVLTNPWWFQEVLGAPATTGSGPYTHEYTTDPVDTPTSMRIFSGNQQSGFERVLAGAIVSDVSISFDVPGEITVSINGAYADEPSETSITSQPTLNLEPLSFHEATLTRAGTTLELVQGADVSMNTNDELIYGLGSRKAVTHNPKQFTVDLDYDKIVETSNDVQRFYGNDTTLQETVNNEEDVVLEAAYSGPTTNRIQLTLNNVFNDELSRSGVGDSEADLEDSLTGIPADVSVTAENSVEIAR